MSISDSLYKDIILDHSENPRHFGELNPHDAHEMGVNPLCGDELELYLNFEGDKITNAMFKGKGCSISQASCSMMTDMIIGLTKKDALELLHKFKGMILEDKEPDFQDEFSDLEALNGVKKYPVRVKCAVLAWNTMEAMLKK